MQTDNFEQTFSDYLATREYDDAEDALFSAIRMAYLAGWKAAGGEVPQPQHKVFRLLNQHDSTE